MAYLNTNNLPSSLPPVDDLTPPAAPSRSLLSRRQLIRGAILATLLLAVIGVSLASQRTLTAIADPAIESSR